LKPNQPELGSPLKQNKRKKKTGKTRKNKKKPNSGGCR
jgi:hypothetical protein